MAYTQQQINDLRAAIASGQLIVRSGDRSIQYRSLSELRSVLAEAEAELAGRPTGLQLGRNLASFRRD
jgi:hypothetical protein